jgi:hypothetical protein
MTGMNCRARAATGHAAAPASPAMNSRRRISDLTTARSTRHSENNINPFGIDYGTPVAEKPDF